MIEVGPARALGRNYSVKLWPTVVVLRDSREVARAASRSLLVLLLTAGDNSTTLMFLL